MAVSFKTQGINTFNMISMDINSKLIKYWHESYQLWESNVTGFMLETSKDFLIISSKGGINLLNLSDSQSNRLVKDTEGNYRAIHPLGSCNYLRIEQTNHIYFAC